MNGFTALRDELLGKLTAAAITVADTPVTITTDPAANVPPFVLVGLITTAAADGLRAWKGTLPVTIAVPPPGDAVAAATLEDLLEDVYLAIGFAPARPGPYSAGENTTTLPAYVLTYPVSIPNPNC